MKECVVVFLGCFMGVETLSLIHVFIHPDNDAAAVLVALSEELSPENVLQLRDEAEGEGFVFLKNHIYRLNARHNNSFFSF